MVIEHQETRSSQYREFFEILRERLELAEPKQSSTLEGWPKQRGDDEFNALRAALEIDEPRLRLYESALGRMRFLQTRFQECQAEMQAAMRENQPNNVSQRLTRVSESLEALTTYNANGGDCVSQIDRLKAELDSLTIAQERFEKRNQEIVGECNAKVLPLTSEMAFVRTIVPRLFGVDGPDLLLPLGREPRTAFESALCACV